MLSESRLDLTVSLIGMLMVAFSLTWHVTPLSDGMNGTLPLTTTILFAAYGLSTVIGGFLRDGASLGYFVDLSAVTGAGLFISGPVLGASGEGLSMKILAAALIFLSVPSTVAAWYTQEE